MVKVYIDTKDDNLHTDLTYANLTKPNIYTKAMKPWTINYACGSDADGVPRTAIPITDQEYFNGALYIKSDGLAMLDLATLTGAAGPVIKIGEQTSASLFLRIGTLSVKSTIQLSGLKHTNVEDED